MQSRMRRYQSIQPIESTAIYEFRLTWPVNKRYKTIIMKAVKNIPRVIAIRAVLVDTFEYILYLKLFLQTTKWNSAFIAHQLSCFIQFIQFDQ